MFITAVMMCVSYVYFLEKHSKRAKTACKLKWKTRDPIMADIILNILKVSLAELASSRTHQQIIAEIKSSYNVRFHWFSRRIFAAHDHFRFCPKIIALFAVRSQLFNRYCAVSAWLSFFAAFLSFLTAFLSAAFFALASSLAGLSHSCLLPEPNKL